MTGSWFKAIPIVALGITTLACDAPDDSDPFASAAEGEASSDGASGDEAPEGEDGTARVPPVDPPDGLEPPLESRALTGAWDYAIVSVDSGLCVTVENGSSASGAWIKQEPCVFDASQLFDKDGRRFKNIGSGKCVDGAYGWLTQQPCNPNYLTQEFVAVGDGTGSQVDYIREDHRYYCIDVPWGTNSAYWLQSYPCNGGLNQDWIVLRVY